jgi:hypothetical protein
MTFPTKDLPTEDPGRTGSNATARTAAADPAEPDAEMHAAADMDADVQADADATSHGDNEAYATPPPDAAAPAGSGSPAVAGSAMDSGTPADAMPSVDTVASQRWNQIRATFVDDPRGSVTQAADMVDEAIEAFTAAARKRQAWLASSWQGRDAGTEELRTALQDYRALWSSVTEIPQHRRPG